MAGKITGRIRRLGMTKRVFVLGALGIVLALAALTGCTTVTSLDRMNPVGGSYQDIRVPNKDITSLGLIFAEYTSEGNGTGSESGEVYTYYKLLQEAQKLGADAIVNVVIEGVQEALTERLLKLDLKHGVTRKVWYGSATAIKYSDTIVTTDEKTVIVIGPDGKEIVSEKASNTGFPLADFTFSSGIGGAAAGGKKWWNPFTWFKK
jgi:hypothetical protein